MYHELLIALSGTPGAIFKVDRYGGLEVTKNLPFLHPSESELLDKLCKLGGFYRNFQQFIDMYSVDLSPVDQVLKNENKRTLQGQYLHAFCAGLTAVLRPYQDALVQIEEQVMKEPYTSLSFVHRGLEDYFFIFPVLSGLIDTIESRKLHGCQVLELLHDEANNGNPSVRKALVRILHACHGVLFKQLSAWMLHGILLDEYKEFFITNKNVGDDGIKRKSETDEIDGGVLSSNTILRGVTGREVLEELQIEEGGSSESLLESRISVDANMLPSYIPLRVAEKIMFIGESVQMLKDTENLKMHSYDEHIADLLHGQENEFLRTLHNLQAKQEFSISALEVEVDSIKSCVAEQLWKLVVEDADLIKHLKLLKEMYLLGRGELYLTLIDHLHTTMKGLPSNQMAYDINAAFKQSLAKILTYSEDYEDLFEMKLDTTIDDSNLKFKSAWDYLRIQYHPPWPLHLLFTPHIMEKFNTLFTFLLKVRRTQIELQNVWAYLMSAKRSVRKSMASGHIWVLRRRMAFFIDNLQYYLQVDVLETQFTMLISKIKKTHNFETINKSLDFFLIQMLSQSFVSMKKVFNILDEIIRHCMQFCEAITMSNDLWDDTTQDEQIENISKDYNKQTSLLFTILSSVRSHQTSPHLAQLLLRIDFNKYYTSKSNLSSTSLMSST